MRKLQRSNLFLDKETLHLHRLRKMGYKSHPSVIEVAFFIKIELNIFFIPNKEIFSSRQYITVLSVEGFEGYLNYNGSVIDYLDKVFNYLDKL